MSAWGQQHALSRRFDPKAAVGSPSNEVSEVSEVSEVYLAGEHSVKRVGLA